MTRIYGAGGGGGKGGGSTGEVDTPTTAEDSLDSKQFAQVLDLISEGEIEGLKNGNQSIFLDNTPLQNPDGSNNFKGVQVVTRPGTQNQSYIPGLSEIEDTTPVGLTVSKGTPIVRSITDSNTDAVKVSITVPQLQKINDSGDVLGTRVELAISVQYNGGGYTQIITDTIKGRTADAYQRDYLISLTGTFPVDIKVERLSDNSTEPKLINAFSWSSYTEIIYAKLRYPNSALVWLRVNAKQFNSIPARAYLVRGIKVRIPSNATVDNTTGRLIYSGIWDGSFSAAVWCSDPAWILWDLLVSTRYGFGDHIEASQLDKFSFYAASQYCAELVPDGFGGQEPRFSCNVNIQTAEEAYKLINDMCSVFRAMPYWSTGALTISQDKPGDTAYLFTLANVSEGGFSYQGSSRKTRPNVCVVSYLDLTTREIAYEAVEDAESIEKYGVVKTEISAFACTSRGQAYRIGEWLLYSERYESEVISFTASVDAGVLVRPGQIIEVADPVRAGARRGGRVSSATTTAITVDDATGLTATGAELSVIMPDGSVETKTISTIVGNIITVDSAFSSAPNINTVWVYQTSNIQTSTWRVLTVQEQDGAVYDISAIAYNASKYDYIERGTALQVRDVSDLNAIPVPPTNLTASEILYDAGGIAKAKIIASWQPIVGVTTYRVEWRAENDNWNVFTVLRPDYEILDTAPGIYEIRVYSVGDNGKVSTEAAQLTVQTVGKTAAPSTPTGINIIPSSDSTAILTWDRSTELDVVLGGKVVIRHSTLTSGATWENSSDIVSAAAGGQTQKQVPLLTGTYLIKFEDDSGNRSTSAATTVVTLPTPQPRLVVQSYREDLLTPPFPGAKNDMAYISEYLGLTFVPGTKVDDLATDGNWDALPSIDASGSTLGSGEYTFNSYFDLGQIYDLNLTRYIVGRSYDPTTFWDDRLDLIDNWQTVEGGALDQVNAALYVRATNDNPAGSPTWGAWNEYVNGLVRGRGFQFKLVVTSYAESQSIIIEQLGTTLELQQRTESIGSLTSGVGSYAVTYSQAFYQAPAVSITPYNMATGDYYTVTLQTRTGFTVTFYNSSNAVVSRNFTYSATGYGREIV